MATLPQPRDFLTSLINTISLIPPQPSPSPSLSPSPSPSPPLSRGASDVQPANRLAGIAAAHRPLLATLHVLFPTLLLPALDLLDRGLVTRLRVRQGGGGPGVRHHHLVRSAQQPRRPGGPAPAYVVRLGAWNCSCPAFAFAAWPPRAAAGDAAEAAAAAAGGDGDGDGAGSWSFGGDSLDGSVGDGGVPCCKHLLACLLAERWVAVLGGYIADRELGGEEMAGIMADM